jgi:hypothetical protein
VLAYSSFTIFRPAPLNSSLLFYNLPDVLDTLAAYFQKTLAADARLPAPDAAAAARRIVAGLKEFAIWKQLANRAASRAPKKAVPKKPAPRKPARKKVAAKKKSGAKKAVAKKPVAKKRARKR